MMKNKNGQLRGKKKLMIESLRKQLGVVTAACENVGVARTTHYEWIKIDPLYKEAVENLPDLVLDFAENALFKQIKSGSIPSTIFYLKTKGKNRGYIEKTEVEHSSNDFHIQVNIPESVKELFDE